MFFTGNISYFCVQ